MARKSRRFLDDADSRQLDGVLESASTALELLSAVCKLDGHGLSAIGVAYLDAAIRRVAQLCPFLVNVHGQPSPHHVSFVIVQHSAFLHNILLPAYSVLLRCTAVDSLDTAACSRWQEQLCELKLGLNRIIEQIVLVDTRFDDREHTTLCRRKDAFVSALIKADTLQVWAQHLAAHREALHDRSNLPKLHNRVREAARALAHGIDLAWSLQECRPAGFNQALAASRLLEHACALRLSLAECVGLMLRDEEGEWAGQELSRSGSAAWGVTLSLADSHGNCPIDWRLLRLLQSCTSNLLTPAEFALNPGAVVTMARHQQEGEAEGSSQPAQPQQPAGVDVTWPALCHPAVQLYLGWWLVAAPALTAQPGASVSARGLPGTLLASCPLRRWSNTYKIYTLETLLTAVPKCWIRVLHQRTQRTPSTSGASPAAVVATAFQPFVDAAADVGGLPANEDTDGQAVGPAVGSVGSFPAASVPYSPLHMYEMLLSLVQRCLEVKTSERPDSAFTCAARIAVEGLVECVLCMSAPAASRRLAAVWRLLLQLMPAEHSHGLAGDMHVGALRAGQLLALLHLRSPTAVRAQRAADAPAVGAGVSDAAAGLDVADEEAADGAESAAQAVNGTGTLSERPSGAAGAEGSDTAAAAADVGGGAAACPSRIPEEVCGAGPQTTDSGAAEMAADGASALGAGRLERSGGGQLAGADPQPASQASSLEQQSQQGQPLPLVQQASQPAYAVACATANDLLPALELRLRCPLGIGASKLEGLCIVLDLALRRPGCWPALAAHGEERQVGALVATLGRTARSAEEVEPTNLDDWTGEKRASVHDPRTACRLQLWALLEQMAAALLGASLALMQQPHAVAEQQQCCSASGGGEEGLAGSTAVLDPPAASAASDKPVLQPHASQLCSAAGMTPRCQTLAAALRSLPLNDALSAPVMENGRRGSSDGAGDSSGKDAAASTAAARRYSSSGAASRGVVLPPGHSWDQVVRGGGCPAAGSPARAQLERMAVMAAAEWLPPLLTTLKKPGTAALPMARLLQGKLPQPTTIKARGLVDLLPHRSYLVAWQWLLLLARQCLEEHRRWKEGSAGWTPLENNSGPGDASTGSQEQQNPQEERVAAGAAAGVTAGPGGGPGTSGSKGGQGEKEGGPPQSSGEKGAVDPWLRLLLKDLDAFGHIRSVLAAACNDRHLPGLGSRSSEGGGSEDCQQAASSSQAGRVGAAAGTKGDSKHHAWVADVISAAVDVLPCALDVLEVLVEVAPEAVAGSLRENSSRAQGAATKGGASEGGDGSTGQSTEAASATTAAPTAQPPAWGSRLRYDPAIAALLVRQGRRGLADTLSRLAAAGEGSSAHGPHSQDQGVDTRSGGEGEEGLTPSLALQPEADWWQAIPVLPTEPLSRGWLVPRCAYFGCTGGSGSEVKLKACARCRTVGYCSATCQRADWVAGHRLQCVGRSGAGPGSSTAGAATSGNISSEGGGSGAGESNSKAADASSSRTKTGSTSGTDTGRNSGTGSGLGSSINPGAGSSSSAAASSSGGRAASNSSGAGPSKKIAGAGGSSSRKGASNSGLRPPAAAAATAAAATGSRRINGMGTLIEMLMRERPELEVRVNVRKGTRK